MIMCWGRDCSCSVLVELPAEKTQNQWYATMHVKAFLLVADGADGANEGNLVHPVMMKHPRRLHSCFFKEAMTEQLC